jgi:hypothetical protein
MSTTFTHWVPWTQRGTLPHLAYPGVYALAISAKRLSGTPFSCLPEIVYFGMTNAKGGLKSRLGQFENTIKGRRGHGGAHRVRFKHPDYLTLTSSLFVSVCRDFKRAGRPPDYGRCGKA